MDRALAFAEQAGWQAADWSPVAGDLSSRRYFRLRRGGKSAILMDACGDTDTTEKFARLTRWLRSNGASVPEIFAASPSEAMMLIEDFGDVQLTQILAGAQKDEALDACLELLLKLRHADPPPALAQPDASELAAAISVAGAHIPNADKHALSRFRAELETILGPILASPATVSLRDFHAENIMWLGHEAGIKRLGLLDYQDAFLTHHVYDLVSFLTDARTDVPKLTRDTYIAKYAALSGDDPEELGAAFAALSAQRNLRILGIFHRAAQMGKPHHLPKVPRVFGYFREALQHPLFDDIRGAVLSALPVELEAS